MRRSNTLSVFSLAWLGFAAVSVAAPAPVSNLNNSNILIKRLERQLEVRNKIQIEMQDQLTELFQEIDELRGKVEKSNYEIKQMSQRQRELYKEIEELRQTKSVSAPKANMQSNNKGTVYSDNHSENTEYNAAVDLILKKKDYAGAVKAFETFIQTYPKSVYAPNVYYWLGQLTLTKGDLTLAKTHFTKVASYSDSNKKAEALLKLGIIASKQSDMAKAKQLFEQVVSDFPGTTVATEAQKLLK